MLETVKDTESLSHFKRISAEVIARMKETGNAVVLTVHGKPEVIIQDTAAYQRLVELAERAEMLDFLEESRQDIDAGRTVPARHAMEELARKYSLSPGEY